MALPVRSRPERAVIVGHMNDSNTINVGDTTNIYGDTTNNYYPPNSTSPSRRPLRVIPYPRNEDVIDRPELVERLNRLLGSKKTHSAALWGLGGSGLVFLLPSPAVCYAAAAVA